MFLVTQVLNTSPHTTAFAAKYLAARAAMMSPFNCREFSFALHTIEGIRVGDPKRFDFSELFFIFGNLRR